MGQLVAESVAIGNLESTSFLMSGPIGAFYGFSDNTCVSGLGTYRLLAGSEVKGQWPYTWVSTTCMFVENVHKHGFPTVIPCYFNIMIYSFTPLPLIHSLPLLFLLLSPSHKIDPSRHVSSTPSS